MGILISDDILQATGMSEADLKKEIAIFLFQKEKITLEQASKLAEMPRLPFQHLLASRQIAPHYGQEELDQDMETLKRLEK